MKLGAIKNRFLIILLRKFEKLIYRKAIHVVALSPGMRDGVLKAGILPQKVSVIPNMSKPDIFYPHKPSDKIIDEFGINLEQTNIIHFGSMGVANGLDYLINTAYLLKKQNISDVNFLFLGDGATLPSLKLKVEKYGLHNVIFLGNHNMRVVAELVNCCDLSITSFKNLPILYTNSPNKLFDSLSAGKPIIVNSAGWTKELVEQHKCGFWVNPDDPQDFVNKILKYKDNQLLLKEWGDNARLLSESSFDKSILSKKIVNLIELNDCK